VFRVVGWYERRVLNRPTSELGVHERLPLTE
jgi:hypothetical protein